MNIYKVIYARTLEELERKIADAGSKGRVKLVDGAKQTSSPYVVEPGYIQTILFEVTGHPEITI